MLMQEFVTNNERVASDVCRVMIEELDDGLQCSTHHESYRRVAHGLFLSRNAVAARRVLKLNHACVGKEVASRIYAGDFVGSNL